MCKQYDVLAIGSIIAILPARRSLSATEESCEEPNAGEALCDAFKMRTTVTTTSSVV